MVQSAAEKPPCILQLTQHIQPSSNISTPVTLVTALGNP